MGDKPYNHSGAWHINKLLKCLLVRGTLSNPTQHKRQTIALGTSHHEKESATSGRLLLVLQTVYSSPWNTALTHMLHDVKTDTSSGSQSMEHSAEDLYCSASSPAVWAIWTDYPMVLTVVMMEKDALWKFSQIPWDNHNEDPWSFGARPWHLQKRIICLWKITLSMLLGPGINGASCLWDTRWACGHNSSS